MMTTENIKTSNLEIFNYIIKNDKKQIRYFTDLNNEIWFVGKDVAECLDYSDTRKAIKTHVDDEDKMTFGDFKLINKISEIIDSRLILINEPGLYSLILSSNMEKAKIFKKWITKEVIPSIRKNGIYRIVKEKDDKIEQLITQNNQIINQNNKLMSRLQNIENQNNTLENKVDIIT